MFQETRSENTTQYDLRVANKIFFDMQEPVRDCVQEIFSKEIELLNIANETEQSRHHINNWIEGETRGKIKDLITDGNMDHETRIAIVIKASSIQFLIHTNIKFLTKGLNSHLYINFIE